jgi:hypothetical protein
MRYLTSSSLQVLENPTSKRLEPRLATGALAGKESEMGKASSPNRWVNQVNSLIGLGGPVLDLIAKAVKLWHEINR